MSAADALTAAYPAARALAARIAGNAEAGDDLVQEAMCRLWSKRDAYPADELPRMLYRTMTNIQRDGHRRRTCVSFVPMPANWTGRGGRDSHEYGDYAPVPPQLTDWETPEAAALRAEEGALVRDVLAGMTQRYRNVLVDQYWDDITPQGSAVKSRAYRARCHFRQAWEAAA